MRCKKERLDPVKYGDVKGTYDRKENDDRHGDDDRPDRVVSEAGQHQGESPYYHQTKKGYKEGCEKSPCYIRIAQDHQAIALQHDQVSVPEYQQGQAICDEP